LETKYSYFLFLQGNIFCSVLHSAREECVDAVGTKKNGFCLVLKVD